MRRGCDIGNCSRYLYPYFISVPLYIIISSFQGVYILYTISSSTNFIIYGVLNKNFRETYLSILMPRLRKARVIRPELLAAQQTKE